MRSNKWLILGLVISVGINVAIAGFFVGRISHGGHPPNLDPTIGFMRVLADLPEARRRELRPLAAERMRQVIPSLRAMRSAQRRLRELILAEPFDQTALEAALTAFRQHLSTSQVVSHRAFVQLITELSPAERRVLVDFIRHPRQGRPGAGRRPGAAPGPEPRGADGKMRDPADTEAPFADNVEYQIGTDAIRHRLPGRVSSAHRDFRF